MATIAEQQESVVYEIGGIEDHVHLLLSLSRTMPLAKLVELIKKESSKWLKQKEETLKMNYAYFLEIQVFLLMKSIYGPSPYRAQTVV